MWPRSGWTVLLDTPRDVRRAVRYVRENPLKDGLPPQRWAFEESAEDFLRECGRVSRPLEEGG